VLSDWTSLQKPHLSAATELIRKRRRTGRYVAESSHWYRFLSRLSKLLRRSCSSPVPPSSNTTNSLSGMDAANVDFEVVPLSVSPASSFRPLHTAGTARPISALHDQANRSLNDFVLFLVRCFRLDRSNERQLTRTSISVRASREAARTDGSKTYCRMRFGRPTPTS
jgi:hypothetical protein